MQKAPIILVSAQYEPQAELEGSLGALAFSALPPPTLLVCAVQTEWSFSFLT